MMRLRTQHPANIAVTAMLAASLAPLPTFKVKAEKAVTPVTVVKASSDCDDACQQLIIEAVRFVWYVTYEQYQRDLVACRTQFEAASEGLKACDSKALRNLCLRFSLLAPIAAWLAWSQSTGRTRQMGESVMNTFSRVTYSKPVKEIPVPGPMKDGRQGHFSDIDPTGMNRDKYARRNPRVVVTPSERPASRQRLRV